eukprot:SAG31_NODE_5618_length_2421_cov_15.170112_3_plen_68_part_01
MTGETTARKPGSKQRMQGPQDSTAAAAGHQAQGDLSRGSRDARGQVGADEAHSAGEPKTQRRQRKTKA